LKYSNGTSLKETLKIDNVGSPCLISLDSLFKLRSKKYFVKINYETTELHHKIKLQFLELNLIENRSNISIDFLETIIC
jgi:hypothetical protein